jgi:hypothetical protein
MISTRDVVFDVIKRYNPDDDQSEALVEVLEVLEILTPDFEEAVNDWETLPLLRSFKTIIKSYGDIVIIDASSTSSSSNPKTTSGSLPTPRDTPEFEQAPTITPVM